MTDKKNHLREDKEKETNEDSYKQYHKQNTIKKH